MKLKIAFLQLTPAATIEDNLEKGIKACREAKVGGADIALFPEMWSSGYVFPHNKKWLEQNAVSPNSAYVTRFSEIALELDMAVAITLLEQHKPKPRNTVCLFDRHGKLVYRYAKVHLCAFGEDDDEGVLDAGNDFLVGALDTKDGVINVGSMICYDREFPEAARILMLKGAELILVPNACPMEINRLSQLRGRAYENWLAIATCNYPAFHRGCNGHSTLFDGVMTRRQVCPAICLCAKREMKKACSLRNWMWICCKRTETAKQVTLKTENQNYMGLSQMDRAQ